MINLFAFPSQNSKGSVVSSEYDPTEAKMSIGYTGMKRSKRDGRNPSVGARGSRRYGLSMVFLTLISPLNSSTNQPIY